ncbi:MAG: LysM peptidoglycan-binding domain-containing protein [Oscillospiraceae bacterium]
MKLTAMKFKDYTWPHNPKVYTMRYERKLVEQKLPFGGYALQDLGLSCRVMEGEGEFCGDGAYDEFKKLATVFYAAGSGTLVHPNWSVTRAYFAELSLVQEPRSDYVRYSFAFWEDVGTQGGGLKAVSPAPKPVVGSPAPTGHSAGHSAENAAYHAVTKGETLWGIAQRVGTTVAAILALNPGIKNPNLIYVGQKVRIR